MDIFLDKKSKISIYRQFCDQLRSAVVEGRIKTGMQLPSTRMMKSELGISRGTVRNVYDQLISEGYLETKSGKGTFVALKNDSQTSINDKQESTLSEFDLSTRAERLFHIFYHPNIRRIRAFMPGTPELREFPFQKWHKVSKSVVHANSDALDYSDPLGYLPLRQAICEHIHLSRGIVCHPQQIVICNGGEEALRLISTLLLDPGDPVWVEDPCFVGRRLVFKSVEAESIPVKIDDRGFIVSKALKQNPKAKLAYVVPSRNYPLGIRMSLSRRIELSEWAQQYGGWIIEDDFDCEFRYEGNPVTPIHSIQQSNRVIYMSSFTTTLLPAFRLAFMVLPKPLLDSMSRLLSLGKPTSGLTQSVLAEFIKQGFYASHIRRMRKLYDKRRKYLLEVIDRKLFESIYATDAGFNVLVQLPKQINAAKLSRYLLTKHDIVAYSLAEYYMNKRISPAHRNTLVLGFACLNKTEIEQSVETLNSVLANWNSVQPH